MHACMWVCVGVTVTIPFILLCFQAHQVPLLPQPASASVWDWGWGDAGGTPRPVWLRWKHLPQLLLEGLRYSHRCTGKSDLKKTHSVLTGESSRCSVVVLLCVAHFVVCLGKIPKLLIPWQIVCIGNFPMANLKCFYRKTAVVAELHMGPACLVCLKGWNFYFVCTFPSCCGSFNTPMPR